MGFCLFKKVKKKKQKQKKDKEKTTALQIWQHLEEGPKEGDGPWKIAFEPCRLSTTQF